MVAIAFIPVPQYYLDAGYTMDTLEVNHKRGGYEIYNNFVSNLEWCTTQENIVMAHESGLCHPNKGSSHHATFFNEDDVIQICECIEKGMNARKTYETVNLSVDVGYKRFKETYYSIKYRVSWYFISQHYNF